MKRGLTLRRSSRRDLDEGSGQIRLQCVGAKVINPSPNVASDLNNGKTQVYSRKPSSKALLDVQSITSGSLENTIKKAQKKKRIVPKSQENEHEELDGFLLLEGSDMEYPEEALRASVVGMDLTSVITNDLSFFVNLTNLDISENSLPFEPFGSLPSLKELHMHCNLIRNIAALAPGSFPKLEILNLSYNCLSHDSILNLAAIPNLRELDLSCNSLVALPEMTPFNRLEVLLLDRNKLDESVIPSLSNIPCLRELSISYNKVASLPYFNDESDNNNNNNNPNGLTEVAPQVPTLETTTPFFCLEWVNLSFNCIAKEIDASALITYPSLQQVLLFGNPMCKKSLKIINKVLDDGKFLSLVLVEPSSKRNPRRKGSAFSNVDFAVVENDNTLLSNAQWRRKGNMRLFDKFGDLRRTRSQTSDVPTLNTNTSRTEATNESTGFFLTEAPIQDSINNNNNNEEDDEELPPFLLMTRPITQAPANEPAYNSQQQFHETQKAADALRFLLRHPMTGHIADPMDEKPVDRLTTIQKIRQVPKREYIPKTRRHPPKNTSFLNKTSNALDAISHAEGGVATPTHIESAMSGIIDMVSQVIGGTSTQNI
eukprot:TRINITY_DN777914_c0_g1_i1.p1 TRINITY_DN777914_c0_g1~~TRINITY_DN777914_c0_g1_i1.p1  ORF type:complete len:599 (-),score=160.40 TRINITY_DN777914_c0_g1_i1:133-1929(-)